MKKVGWWPKWCQHESHRSKAVNRQSSASRTVRVCACAPGSKVIPKPDRCRTVWLGVRVFSFFAGQVPDYPGTPGFGRTQTGLSGPCPVALGLGVIPELDCMGWMWPDYLALRQFYKASLLTLLLSMAMKASRSIWANVGRTVRRCFFSLGSTRLRALVLLSLYSWDFTKMISKDWSLVGHLIGITGVPCGITWFIDMASNCELCFVY